MAVWLSSGSVPFKFDDALAIVKVKTMLPLDWVLEFVPPDMFYHAETQHRQGHGSKWKNGYVGDRQHITIQVGLYPNGFQDRSAFYAFVRQQADLVGPIDDLTVKGAISWAPPPGCIEKGDLNYRCVVLELCWSRKALILRDRLREHISGFDRYGVMAKFHVTVAYICDPLDREDVTEQMANALVDRLNELYRGQTVPVGPLVPDDNSFPFYGSSLPITAHIT